MTLGDGKGMYTLYHAARECIDDAADMLDVDSSLEMRLDYLIMFI